MSADLSSIRVERVSDGFRVWIPPTKPEHRDTDGWSDLGPYGDTYFDTLPEALRWLSMVLATLAEVPGGYSMEYLPTS